MKKIAVYLLMGLFIVSGIAVLLYPSISNWYNSQYQIIAIERYDNSIEKMSIERIEEELQKAEEYNHVLTNQVIKDPFISGSIQLPENYTSILNVNNGIMGSIQIPKININLPIYHGTNSDVLDKGVGHMEMTAFPIGGAGNHSVLTGHTGLPNSMLFTDLVQLEVGDVFYIKIYKNILAYRVDQIMVVKPDNTKPLIPESGKDYISLVTCTPYGVNSHRLLVRGNRIPYTNEELDSNNGLVDTIVKNSNLNSMVITLIVIVIVIIVVVIILARKLSKKNKK